MRCTTSKYRNTDTPHVTNWKLFVSARVCVCVCACVCVRVCSFVYARQQTNNYKAAPKDPKAASVEQYGWMFRISGKVTWLATFSRRVPDHRKRLRCNRRTPGRRLTRSDFSAER